MAPSGQPASDTTASNDIDSKLIILFAGWALGLVTSTATAAVQRWRRRREIAQLISNEIDYNETELQRYILREHSDEVSGLAPTVRALGWQTVSSNPHLIRSGQLQSITDYYSTILELKALADKELQEIIRGGDKLKNIIAAMTKVFLDQSEIALQQGAVVRRALDG